MTHHAPVMTAAWLAQLDAMRPELDALMQGDGVDRYWLHHRTSIPVKLLVQWLRAQGATRAHSNGRWRLPNVKRLRTTLNARHSSYAS